MSLSHKYSICAHMYISSLSTTLPSSKLLQGGIYTLHLATLSGFLKSLFHGRAPSSPRTLTMAPDGSHRRAPWVGKNKSASQWARLLLQLGLGTTWGSPGTSRVLTRIRAQKGPHGSSSLHPCLGVEERSQEKSDAWQAGVSSMLRK